jgi:cytoskeleton protein RodZ
VTRNKLGKKNKHVAEADASAADDASAVGPGTRLRAAREALGASVDEVAHDLHLERDVILSLESEDYESLGAPVFVRGYMRSYARLMNLPEDEVVVAVEAQEPEPEEFRTLSARTEVKPGASMTNFVLWMLLAIVALAGVVYLLLGDEQAPVSATDKGEFVAPAPVAAPVVPEPPAQDEVVAETVSSEESAESESEFEVTEAAAVPKPEPEPKPVVVEPVLVQLTLSFAQECWVEISDTQNRLLYGLEKPDTTVTIEGQPPFRLFIGNVQGFSMKLNGKDFTVPRASRFGNNTARFTINEDDVPEANEQ